MEPGWAKAGTKAVDCLKRKLPTVQERSFINDMTYKKMTMKTAGVVVVEVSVNVFVNKVLAN